MALINYAQALNDLAEDISEMSEGNGFWDPDGVGDVGIIPLKLALVHDEVSEALQVHRDLYDDSDPDPNTLLTDMQEDDFTEEIADVIIRSLDLCGYYGFNIGDTLLAKLDKNRSRPFKHGKRY